MTSKQSMDDVRRAIMEAVEIAQEETIPEKLRVSAFEKAFEALIGVGDTKSAEEAAVGSSPEGRDQSNGGDLEVPADGPSLEAVASKLRLSPALVSEIFYADGDVLGVALASSRFPRKKAAATQEIALLVAAGRQAGGWDEWTPVSRIRDVCRDYGFLDPPNFATTVKRMGEVFSYRGRARNLEVRVTRPGFEQASELAARLGGGA